MPIYEYVCKDCGEQFEVEQRITDDALETHEKCGGKLAKVFSSAGIVLKGSGFYKTDSRGSSSKKALPKDNQSSPTSSEPKTADKPSKSESKNTKSTNN